MAQKKITDLQLVSSITDSANWILDTGIQTYRATSTQLMTYIYSKLNALTQVTPVAADNVQIFDASDSNNPKRALLSHFRNAVYRAVNTTDSVGVDDETMVLSGASFTSTLPTAVGVAGKKYKFLHAGTALSQVYTLATTSAQTIGGIASGSYALYTTGEVLEIESDGANWIIVGRYASTTPASYTPSVIGFGTISNLNVEWWREGRNMCIVGGFTSGTSTSTEGQFPLPGGTILTGNPKRPFGIAVKGHATDAQSFILGSGGDSFLNFAIQSSSQAGIVEQNGNAFLASGQSIYFNARVPMTGWQP